MHLLLLLVSAALTLDARGQSSVTGRIVDPAGRPISAAHVELTCAEQHLSAVSDARGEFAFTVLHDGRCLIAATAEGFRVERQQVDVGTEPRRLTFQLQISPFASEVVVSAARGLEEDTTLLPQGASRVSRADLDARPYTIVTQALREEPGILSQQTTASQGSPIVRGFTGQRNLYLLDGVRYNTAAWRDGPSQYLAWLPASNVDHVEIVRGPGSAQYGSDALGATISLFSPAPRFEPGPYADGSAMLTLASANALRATDVHVATGRGPFTVRLGATVSEVGDLRPGGGTDSHAAVTRYLGLDSSVLGRRLRNTGFRQTAGHAALGWKLDDTSTVTASFVHASQSGAHRYDQEMGGNGQFRSEFGPQQLDFAVLRYSTRRVGWFDALSTTFSINRQADGRLTQTRPNQRVDEQSTTTTALGYQVEGTRALSPRAFATFGGEVYDEHIGGERTLTELSGDVRAARPDIPDGTRYRSFGLYWQQIAELVPGRLQARGGARYGRFAFWTRPDSTFGVTDERVTMDDVTFNGGIVWNLGASVSITGGVSRGFRAANAYDFGGIGLSGGAGFEISPSRAIALGGERGSTDGATAIATGRPIEPLEAEQLYAYEAGIRWHSPRLTASLTAFQLSSRDLIERRTVIFNRSMVGEEISGYTIIRQDTAGRAYVQGEARPLVTRVNVSRARIRGFEAEGTARLAAAWRARAWGAMANGRELETGAFLRRMPPVSAGATLTWQQPRSRLWIEGVLQGAFEQTRLSDGDRGDARIGARRSASSIASFFNGTASDIGLVRDGVLVSTGETLAQVQARVLADGAVMFTAAPAYWVVGVRGSVPLGSRTDLILIGENLTDRNYRIFGSGVDEPGVNVQARLRLRF